MTDAPDADERQFRTRLRRMIDGPPADEAPSPQPLVQVHVIPEPTEPETTDEDEGQEDDEPEEQEEQARPWHYVLPGPFGGRRIPDPAPTPQETLAAAPGIHVTVNQPPPQAPWAPPVDTRAQERLHRRRIWFAYHGGAAAVGWFLGLPQQMAELLTAAGPAGAPAGIALGLVAYIIGAYLPGLPFVPPPLRPVIVWTARIPVCSAALALALYAPGTV